MRDPAKLTPDFNTVLASTHSDAQEGQLGHVWAWPSWAVHSASLPALPSGSFGAHRLLERRGRFPDAAGRCRRENGVLEGRRGSGWLFCNAHSDAALPPCRPETVLKNQEVEFGRNRERLQFFKV